MTMLDVGVCLAIDIISLLDSAEANFKHPFLYLHTIAKIDNTYVRKMDGK